MWPRLNHQDIELFKQFQISYGEPPAALKAVFFDIGSVLIDLDWDSFFARQHELNPDSKDFSLEQMMVRLRDNQWMVRWCTGRIGAFQYTQGTLEAAGHSPEHAHNLALGIERLSNGVFAPALVKELSSLIVGPARPRVVRLIQKLRKQGFIVGALSNATPWHESDIMRTVSLHELFDVVLFSQDLGTEKPDPKIYLAAHQAAQKIFELRCEAAQLPCQQLTTQQLAFVDDTPVNIRAARALGWQSNLVCLLKDDILKSAKQLSASELSTHSANSKNLVFADEAAQRVEWLFADILSSTQVK